MVQPGLPLTLLLPPLPAPPETLVAIWTKMLVSPWECNRFKITLTHAPLASRFALDPTCFGYTPSQTVFETPDVEGILPESDEAHSLPLVHKESRLALVTFENGQGGHICMYYQDENGPYLFPHPCTLPGLDYLTIVSCYSEFERVGISTSSWPLELCPQLLRHG